MPCDEHRRGEAIPRKTETRTTGSRPWASRNDRPLWTVERAAGCPTSNACLIKNGCYSTWVVRHTRTARDLRYCCPTTGVKLPLPTEARAAVIANGSEGGPTPERKFGTICMCLLKCPCLCYTRHDARAATIAGPVGCQSRGGHGAQGGRGGDGCG